MADQQETDLKQYVWKNRLLVVNATAKSEVAKQVRAFESEPEQTRDRNLLYIQVGPEQKALWQRFDFKNEQFKMVLVGKDGGGKQIYREVTPMSEIYKVIDAMPMRQREMQK